LSAVRMHDVDLRVSIGITYERDAGSVRGKYGIHIVEGAICQTLLGTSIRVYRKQFEVPDSSVLAIVRKHEGLSVGCPRRADRHRAVAMNEPRLGAVGIHNIDLKCARARCPVRGECDLPAVWRERRRHVPGWALANIDKAGAVDIDRTYFSVFIDTLLEQYLAAIRRKCRGSTRRSYENEPVGFRIEVEYPDLVRHWIDDLIPVRRVRRIERLVAFNICRNAPRSERLDAHQVDILASITITEKQHRRSIRRPTVGRSGVPARGVGYFAHVAAIDVHQVDVGVLFLDVGIKNNLCAVGRIGWKRVVSRIIRESFRLARRDDSRVHLEITFDVTDIGDALTVG